MKCKYIIRLETPVDYRAVEAMTQRAFWNRYKRGCDEHLLVHNIRNSSCYRPEFSRVAETDGKIVGLIMYSECAICSGGKAYPVLTFGPLCVDPAYQSCGIGGALIRETITLANDTAYPGIVIFGDPGYYSKHGFLTCDHFGITDRNGGNSPSLLGYELHPGALSAIGGRFREDEVFEKLDGVDEFNKSFDPYPPISLPLQWCYEGETEDNNGYKLTEGRFHRGLYQEIFDEYVLDLGQYHPKLLEYPVSEDGHRLTDEVNSSFASPSKRQYIITCGGEAAGLVVFSGPDPGDEPDGCTHYIEELYVKPKFRRKGIGNDIALRYLHQNDDGGCGLCVIKANENGITYWENIAKRGGYSFTRSDIGDFWWYVLTKE